MIYIDLFWLGFALGMIATLGVLLAIAFAMNHETKKKSSHGCRRSRTRKTIH